MSHPFTEEQLRFATSHENRSDFINSGRLYGCYACCTIFPYEELLPREGVDRYIIYARCPRCRVNSIIGESDQYPLTQAFLEALEVRKFDLRTEEKWLQKNDPVPLDRYLEPRLSDRKKQLFACASIRLFWDRLIDDRSKQLVEMSEAFAEGQVTIVDFLTYCFKQIDNTDVDEKNPPPEGRKQIKLDEVYAIRRMLGYVPSFSTSFVMEHLSDIDNSHSSEQTLHYQADLLRDLFGSPFHQPKLNSDWLTWNNSTVLSVAEKIYSERAFDLMPILADALQEAGCDDQRILSHCREEKVHAKGCWVVDLLLQKE
jgi:hypothetical protein